MSTQQEQLRSKRVKDLRRKADMQASIHSALADTYGWYYSFLRYTTLFFSAFLLALTFVSEDFITSTLPLSGNSFRWVRAGVSVVNFYAGLVLLIWKPADVATRHRAAVEHYSSVHYALRSLEERPGPLDETSLNEIRAKYLDVGGLPHISDRRFLRMKKRHLMKISISRFLDDHPHSWIGWTRVRLWWRDTWAPLPKEVGSSREQVTDTVP